MSNATTLDRIELPGGLHLQKSAGCWRLYSDCAFDHLATLTEADAERYRALAQGVASAETPLLRALLMCAASCQGGHSDTGRAVADLLDVSFPLTMEGLSAKARALGFDPDGLWPWWVRMREQGVALGDELSAAEQAHGR